MKKRIIGLDILRDIGVIFIFLYHFFIEYIVTGQGTDGAMYGYNYFFNILARPASIFLFLISGYALMYNHEDDLPLGKYYLRRFKGLFIPFYIAYTIMFVACYIVNGQVPGAGIARRFFIFTITGTDGVAQMLYPTFYLIGEWFMSCIVFCYLVFPLLAWGLKKCPGLVGGLLCVLYCIMLFFNPFRITQLMNPLLLVFYFYCGMELYQKNGNRPFKKSIREPAAVFAALIFAYFLAIGYNPAFEQFKMSQEKTEIIYLGLSIFLFVALKDINLKEDGLLYKAIAYLSGISWFIILTHHRIMILFYSHIDVASLTHKQIWLLLIVCIALTWLAAEAVKIISNKVKAILFKKKN